MTKLTKVQRALMGLVIATLAVTSVGCGAQPSAGTEPIPAGCYNIGAGQGSPGNDLHYGGHANRWGEAAMFGTTAAGQCTGAIWWFGALITGVTDDAAARAKCDAIAPAGWDTNVEQAPNYWENGFLATYDEPFWFCRISRSLPSRFLDLTEVADVGPRPPEGSVALGGVWFASVA